MTDPEDIHKSKYSFFFSLDRAWYSDKRYLSLVDMREANKFHFEIFSPSKSPKVPSKDDIKVPKRWSHDELLELYLDQKNWKKTKNRRFLSKLLCRFTLDGNDYVLPVDSWRIRENLEQYITNYACKENIIPISKLQITTTARHSCSPDCPKQIVRNLRANSKIRRQSSSQNSRIIPISTRRRQTQTARWNKGQRIQGTVTTVIRDSN